MHAVIMILVPFIAAHLMVPVRADEDLKLLSRKTLLAGILQAGISYVLVGRWTLWFIPFAVLILHVLLTGLMTLLRPKGKLLAVVCVEFGGALLLLGLSVYVIRSTGRTVPEWIDRLGQLYPLILVHLIGVLATVGLGSRVVEAAVEPLQVQLTAQREKQEASGAAPVQGLIDGGRTIGMLERSLMYVLIVMGQIAAVGFLIAAKSIFRIGEITEKGNRMEAEYILIGTLWSFLFGISAAALTLALLQWLELG